MQKIIRKGIENKMTTDNHIMSRNLDAAAFGIQCTGLVTPPFKDGIIGLENMHKQATKRGWRTFCKMKL